MTVPATPKNEAATVALTAQNPPGLLAGINFAGGRGSKADHDVCNPDDLVHTYKEFGKRSRIPMLWLYAQNDKFFWPVFECAEALGLPIYLHPTQPPQAVIEAWLSTRNRPAGCSWPRAC